MALNLKIEHSTQALDAEHRELDLLGYRPAIKLCPSQGMFKLKTALKILDHSLKTNEYHLFDI